MPRQFRLPPALAARPRTTSGLPIPFVAGTGDDGTPDFSVIDACRVHEAAERRLCSLCGSQFGYWIAFLGGPECASTRVFVDGPAHEDCLLAAIALCPYLARQSTRRIARLASGAVTPAGFDARKPDTFILGVTRQYRTFIARGALLHKAAPFVRVRTFEYVGGELVERGA